jgi:hypothetical protein
MWTWFKDLFAGIWYAISTPARVISKPVVEPIKEIVKPKPAERPNLNKGGQKLLWVPFAERLKPMKAQGKYPKGYAEGLVVHFSAGSSMTSTMDWGRGEGYLFFGIDKKGKLYQTNPLNEWGHHAGVSKWPGLGSGLSNRLVGVEIDNAGRLESIGNGKFKSWFGRVFTEDQVRYVKTNENQQEGWYEKYSQEQEDTLFAFIVWLKENNPEVFKIDWVLGHDEIAKYVDPKDGKTKWRKNDPGGALSVTMPEFRKKLNKHFWG